MFGQIVRILMFTFIIILIGGCKPETDIDGLEQKHTLTDDIQKHAEHDSVTDNEVILRFLEIGSDGCTPCKMMKPVMEKVKKNYSNVGVLFYEVYSDTGRVIGQTYNVRIIPTQIFLNNENKVVKRHEGYYAYEDLIIFIDSFIAENE